MCDYCGCRRQPEIAELSREHDRILDTAYDLKLLAPSAPHEEVLALLDAGFTALLAHHTGKEERGVFAQLRERSEADARLDALVDEHRDLEADLATVRAGGPGWRDVLRRMVEDLSRHVTDEEVDLFPYAMYELRGDEWDRVAQAHADARRLPQHATLSPGQSVQ